jgi:hypothetical protein
VKPGDSLHPGRRRQKISVGLSAQIVLALTSWPEVSFKGMSATADRAGSLRFVIVYRYAMVLMMVCCSK